MNKNQKFLLTGLLILITIFLYSTVVYNLDYVRGIAIKLLLTKDGYSNINVKNDLWLADINNLSNNSNATPSTATSTEEVVTQKTFEYKMMIDPDGCTLNKLGSDGWEISQTSPADLDLIKGFDETCRKSGSFPTLPWVLFVRK